MNTDDMRAIALANVQQPGDIEREELDDGSVAYRNVLLLAPGVWGDSASQRHFLYSERTTEMLADNIEATTVNLFHERENETVAVGELDPDSVFVGEDDDGLYGDLRLSMDNDASRLADDLLQQAFETAGRQGLQGPSLEIRGEEYEFDATRSVHELVDGAVVGVGLVGLGMSPGPGSKDAAFAKQAQQRAVALSSTDSATVLTYQDNVPMDTDHVLEQLSERDISLGDDPDEETLRTLANAFEIELQEDEEEDEDDNPDDEPEEEEDEEMELSDVAEQVQQTRDTVESLSEQVTHNAERIDALADATETLQDEDFSLSELADSVTGLSESIDEMDYGDRLDTLEEQLTELQEQPEEPAALMDTGDAQTHELAETDRIVGLGEHEAQLRL